MTRFAMTKLFGGYYRRICQNNLLSNRIGKELEHPECSNLSASSPYGPSLAPHRFRREDPPLSSAAQKSNRCLLSCR